MKGAFFLAAAALMSVNVAAVDLDEQTRRCTIEQKSLRKKAPGKGPECVKLDVMLGLDPYAADSARTERNDRNRTAPAPRRVFDPSTKRWCWIYGNGAPMQCD